MGTLSNGRATARVRIVGLTNLTRGKRALLFFSPYYHHAHNTVVRNADDLIAEFWRKNPHKKRTSAKPKLKTSPQKARKSAARDDGSDIGSTSVKKRGRKSVGKVGSDDEMDIDEVVERPPKKAKKNAVNAKKAQSESSDAEERIVQSMDRYMDKLNWEALVKNVDTVERVGDVLMVFFTLYVPSYFFSHIDVSKHFLKVYW